MDNLETPIQRAESLSQQVYRYIRESILQGKIEPGERIVESRLATDLQVSRSPIREALRLLIAEQMVVEKDGNLHVLEPSFADFRELYDLRLALESTMASLAAERLLPHHLQGLRENLDQTAKLLEDGTLEKLPEVNSVFHELIWDAAGNKRIYAILKDVSALINYYCYLIFKVNRLQTNILQEHGSVVAALEARNKEAAGKAMHAHIMRDLSIIERAYGSKDEADTSLLL